MLTKEEGRKNLPLVIERFRRWKSEGRLLKNEDDVKTLIEELFEKVLGWDKDDMYRERHPGPNSKRADFQFKDKCIIKLILETKALDVQWTGNVKKQAIGYGWSANKEYVVLTNFQSLILFNAKWKDEDKRIFEIENMEGCLLSEQKFDFLWLLSKESFITGKIDEFSESIGKKLKKAEISTIDKQLLNDLKKWREMLTKDIKSLNELSEEKIDEIVQKIINRFIFIRVCEDRGLSSTITDMLSYLRLWQEKRTKPLLEHLLFIFHHYDDVYDGTIFQKNDPCEKIQIHNNVLEKIIEHLYIAEGLNVEYNFAFIDADVLGSVYEEYLGYLLKGKKITENHAHRKEQGIYYTPTYIVDYIVRNTLGEVLKQSKEIDKIKVLDPACGSGSFLIKAFDIFSEFWKKKIGEEKFNREIKNSILTNNLYGVDLDPKAVEIAQLNLFLKIGEKGELPKLRENIKNGNSLIDDEKISEKAFKWEREFEDIMKEGGFDVVIGNPPYFNIKSDDILKNSKDFSSLSAGIVNSASLFLKKGFDLLKENGTLGFIIPKSFLIVDSWEPIRKIILEKSKIINVYDVGMAFEEVGLEQVIIILRKIKPNGNEVKIINGGKEINTIPQIFFQKRGIILTSLDKEKYKIILKMEKDSIRLGDFTDMPRGITVNSSDYQLKSSDDLIQVLGGTNLEKYRIKEGNKRKPNRYLKKNDKRILQKNNIFRNKRIVYQNIASSVPKIIATIEAGNLPTDDTLNNLVISDSSLSYEYILALLNSKLIEFYLRYAIINCSILTIHLDKPYLGKMPIKRISVGEQTSLIKLVDKMFYLNENLNNKKTEEEKDKTNKEIDDLIYKLYDITDEERKIIESS
jgi:hypothetical protein